MIQTLSISELETAIRDFISHPRKQNELFADRSSWNALCSALDVIGDTQLAMEAYAKWESRCENGEKYLLVYGVLQVMEVQQDAIRYACEILEVPYSPPKELDPIRIIRDEAIGHPMRRRQEKALKSSFVQRAGMTQWEFTLLTVFSDRRGYVFRQVKIVDLIGTQESFLTRMLQSIVEKLRSDEMAHREKHKGELLQNLFPKPLGYMLSKVTEMSEISGPCLQEMTMMLSRFREALEKRNEWISDSEVVYCHKRAEYAAREMQPYFENHRSRLNSDDIYIFATFLKMQIEYLFELAKELDDEYCSEVLNRP